MHAETWSLERVREETRMGIARLLALAPGASVAAEIDTSYITQALLDHYRAHAQEKDAALCLLAGDKENVACFWGNHWARISANQWAYTNSNPTRGCDPVTEGCLCGSGYAWKATVSKMVVRTCPNAAASAYMAWP